MKVDEMAQIIHLPLKANRKVTSHRRLEAMLSAHLRDSVSEIVSCKNEMVPLAGKLEASLENLRSIAIALTGSPQGQLQDVIQLLRERLSSAVGELNCALDELPFGLPSQKADHLIDISTWESCLNLVQANMLLDHGVQPNVGIDPPSEQSRDVQTSRIG
jgi:hypothetical protein